MKTKVEIIDETVAYYSKHRRATSGLRCYYLMIDSVSEAQCAVGRCFTNEAVNVMRQHLEEVGRTKLPYYLNDFNVSNACGYNNSPEHLLKEEYKGHEVEFWSDLQRLHDSSYYWYNNGLTELGQSEVERMKENYGS